MSVINKKPYINKVLEELGEDNLEALSSLINGGSGTAIFRSFINLSYFITNSDRGVSRCKLETKEKLYTGYLVYGTNHCTLIFYGDNQSLGMLEIDVSNISYARVDEYLDINELRSELDDAIEIASGGDVTAEKIAILLDPSVGIVADLSEDSESVELHLDLTGGSAGKVLAINNDGDDVEWVDASEGGTYDGAIDETSSNAVQNSVIAAALELKLDIADYLTDEEVNTIYEEA